MAERDFKDFEINFEAELKKLDEKIKVPEIPDVQNIFEQAESEKTNVVPFKKYSRYVAVAAAVVLICVSIPLISPALSAEMAPQEPMEAPKIFDYYTADSVAEEAVIEPEVCPEEPCEAEAEDSSEIYDSNSSVAGTVTEEVRLKNALIDFFVPSANEDIKEQSSLPETVNKLTEGSAPLEPEKNGSDDVNLIEKKLNKKRSIEISVEEESVSVRLFDDSAAGEVISAFWVEGTFENCGLDGETYYINLVKNISGRDVAEDMYLPMAGDSVNGTYFVPEESVMLPEKIEKGAIALLVEINIATGEYEIHARVI